jgi:hypothetical protein
MAQPSPSAEDRFLTLSARSSARTRRSPSDRIDPFGKFSTNDRSLRILLKNSQIEQLRKSRSGAQSVV